MTAGPKTKKPPAVSRPGVWRLSRDLLRRSWIEVALPATHRGPDVLVVDEGDRRPRGVGGHGGRSLVRGIDVRIEELEADIELRHRVELGARPDFVEAEVGIAAVAGAGGDHGEVSG